MEKIKLICSDVDGTLIDSNGRISEADRAALHHAAVDLNIPFAIVSGRFRGGLDCILKQLDFDAAISCFNGLYVEMGGKVVRDAITDKAILGDVVPLIREYGCTPLLFSLDDWVMEDKNCWFDNQVKVCGFEGKTMRMEKALSSECDMNFYKILAKNTDHEKLEQLKRRFLEIGFSKLHAVFSSPNILEFLPMGTTKADTVDILAKYLGISTENVMAFGDYDNDIGMLQRAGFGVCMANGTDSTKAVSDYVTASNEDFGISKALEKLVFSTDSRCS
ncbi:MAG: Cof-type HAD-IIB family hydrolase [Sphaerochaetaceae bacterium]|jgi:Cof subfamily protein (haloacid dehalogenase superfamily)|nr:Cof-type HAD-IIB family hydrolase [Sphaerochaetaceae bacterium]